MMRRSGADVKDGRAARRTGQPARVTRYSWKAIGRCGRGRKFERPCAPGTGCRPGGLRYLQGMKFLILSATVALLGAAEHDWPAYGGGPAGIRYSPLKQINRAKVSKLSGGWRDT